MNLAERDTALGAAREAYARRDWRAARDGFRAAAETGALATDDVYALSQCAWWLGEMDDCIRLLEEAYRRYLDEGDERAAALVALELGIDHLLRGDEPVGSGWLGRAPLLAQVEAPVIEAFRNGGGVPYSAYRDFHALMADENGKVFDAALVDTILPLVDGLTDRLAAGIDLADIGCGSGRAVNIMAREFPASRFVGYDFSEEAIAVARAEAADLGLANARFELADVAELEAVGDFDVVTAFDAIHDQAHPAEVLTRVHRALRPGGTFLMADIRASSHLHENLDIPWAPFLYTVSTMHCMTVSLALDGEGLGTVWGRQRACGMLDDAGFVDVEVREIDSDPFNLYYIARKA